MQKTVKTRIFLVGGPYHRDEVGEERHTFALQSAGGRNQRTIDERVREEARQISKAHQFEPDVLVEILGSSTRTIRL